MEGKAVVAALLSTLLIPLLLSHQPRAIVADHLSIAALAGHLPVGVSGTTAALFDACSGFRDLLSRRNHMILLCNAILLIVLRNAGLLASPADARRNGGDGAGISTAATSFVTAAADSPVESSRRRPHTTRSHIVVWHPSKLAVVAVLDADENDDGDRLTRRRPTQRHEPATALTMAPSALPPAGEEKQNYDGLDDDHVSAGAIVIVEDAKISSPVSDSHHHRSAGHDTNERDEEDDAEALDQCGGGGADDDDDDDDVDDMNRRFEEFIANTKRKMQLESLQLQLVMKV